WRAPFSARSPARLFCWIHRGVATLARAIAPMASFVFIRASWFETLEKKDPRLAAVHAAPAAAKEDAATVPANPVGHAWLAALPSAAPRTALLAAMPRRRKWSRNLSKARARRF